MRKIAVFAIWALFALILVILALIPDLIRMENNADKMLHITAFCLLMLYPAMTLSKIRHVLLVVLFMLALGLGIEFAQTWSPGRQSSIEDMIANVGGILAGLVIGYLLRPDGTLPRK